MAQRMIVVEESECLYCGDTIDAGEIAMEVEGSYVHPECYQGAEESAKDEYERGVDREGPDGGDDE